MFPKDIPVPFPIEFKQVPNYGKGRPRNPDMIVIHIAEGLKDSVYQTFMTEPKSSHFLVNKDGTIWQFVSTKDTAWCNGIVVVPISEIVLTRLPANPNGYTLSIENEGFGSADITPAQYTSNAALVKFLSQKWGVPLDRSHVIRHEEIEASKTCPGRISVEKIIQLARK